MAERQAITEEQGTHKAWYEARPTLAELPEFLRHLMEDYHHDYGTICHAIAAGTLATMYAMDESPNGGITGFQSGCIFWEIARRWLGLEGKPLRLLDYTNLAYPQYEDKFTSISPKTWEWVQGEARKRLADDNSFTHPQVLAHWESIAAGQVPFGLRIVKD